MLWIMGSVSSFGLCFMFMVTIPVSPVEIEETKLCLLLDIVRSYPDTQSDGLYRLTDQRCEELENHYYKKENPQDWDMYFYQRPLRTWALFNNPCQEANVGLTKVSTSYPWETNFDIAADDPAVTSIGCVDYEHTYYETGQSGSLDIPTRVAKYSPTGRFRWKVTFPDTTEAVNFNAVCSVHSSDVSEEVVQITVEFADDPVQSLCNSDSSDIEITFAENNTNPRLIEITLSSVPLNYITPIETQITYRVTDTREATSTQHSSNVANFPTEEYSTYGFVPGTSLSPSTTQSSSAVTDDAVLINTSTGNGYPVVVPEEFADTTVPEVEEERYTTYPEHDDQVHVTSDEVSDAVDERTEEPVGIPHMNSTDIYTTEYITQSDAYPSADETILPTEAVLSNQLTTEMGLYELPTETPENKTDYFFEVTDYKADTSFEDAKNITEFWFEDTDNTTLAENSIGLENITQPMVFEDTENITAAWLENIEDIDSTISAENTTSVENITQPMVFEDTVNITAALFENIEDIDSTVLAETTGSVENITEYKVFEDTENITAVWFENIEDIDSTVLAENITSVENITQYMMATVALQDSTFDEFPTTEAAYHLETATAEMESFPYDNTSYNYHGNVTDDLENVTDYSYYGNMTDDLENVTDYSYYGNMTDDMENITDYSYYGNTESSHQSNHTEIVQYDNVTSDTYYYIYDGNYGNETTTNVGYHGNLTDDDHYGNVTDETYPMNETNNENTTYMDYHTIATDSYYNDSIIDNATDISQPISASSIDDAHFGSMTTDGLNVDFDNTTAEPMTTQEKTTALLDTTTPASPVVVCAPGYERVGDICVGCKTDYFRDETFKTDQPCKKCPKGYITLQDNATICTQDPCDVGAMPCDYGATCHRGKCRCPPSCSHDAIVQSVCASDGKTYASECDIRAHMCPLQITLHVVHQGACKPPPLDPCVDVICKCGTTCKNGSCNCVNTTGPVCAHVPNKTEWRTYNSECHMGMAACEQNLDLKLLYKVACEEIPVMPDVNVKESKSAEDEKWMFILGGCLILALAIILIILILAMRKRKRKATGSYVVQDDPHIPLTSRPSKTSKRTSSSGSQQHRVQVEPRPDTPMEPDRLSGCITPLAEHPGFFTDVNNAPIGNPLNGVPSTTESPQGNPKETPCRHLSSTENSVVELTVEPKQGAVEKMEPNGGLEGKVNRPVSIGEMKTREKPTRDYPSMTENTGYGIEPQNHIALDLDDVFTSDTQPLTEV